MNDNTILVGVIDAAAFMLCASFLAYMVAIVLPLLRHRPDAYGDPSQFEWHFLVPCRDEERVIEDTLLQVVDKFPLAHMWCIDDASGDDTPAILARLAAENRRIHAVTRRLPNAHEGKGPALNAGWQALVQWLPGGADTERVIVGVLDADGGLDAKCLEVITGPPFFANPEISAVQIRVRIVNETKSGVGATTGARLLTRLQDIEFTGVIPAMQLLRRHLGSAGLGGNGQFTRLSTLQRVAVKNNGVPWRQALIEDFELGLHILLIGGRTEYCHDTWVSQQGPPTLGRLIRQRSRWAQGMMECLRYSWPVLRSGRITTGAAMEITYFLFLPWFQLLGGLVYLAFLGGLCYAAFAVPGGPVQWLNGGAWGLVPLFLIFGLTPLVVWGPIYRRSVAQELTLPQAIGLGLLNWPYTYVHHVSTWWAFFRVVRSRHDWMKTERLDLRHDRQVPASAPPPVAVAVAIAAAPSSVGAASFVTAPATLGAAAMIPEAAPVVAEMAAAAASAMGVAALTTAAPGGAAVTPAAAADTAAAVAVTPAASADPPVAAVVTPAAVAVTLAGGASETRPVAAVVTPAAADSPPVADAGDPPSSVEVVVANVAAHPLRPERSFSHRGRARRRVIASGKIRAPSGRARGDAVVVSGQLKAAPVEDDPVAVGVDAVPGDGVAR